MHFSFKRPLYSFTIPFLSLMIICLSSQAQRRSPGMNADGNLLGGSKASSGGGGYLPTEGWGIAQNIGYEMPMGELKETYKGAPTFGISVIKRWNHFIISGTVDYRNFKPKQATTELDPTQPGFGTYTISNFTGIGLYLGGAYEFLITQGSGFYIGFNGGSIYSFSSVDIDTPLGSQSSPNNTTIPYIAPKIGLNFAVTGALSVGLEARYSLKYGGGTYNSREGGTVIPAFSSAAGNLVIAYSF
jgi:hypothetical protein